MDSSANQQQQPQPTTNPGDRLAFRILHDRDLRGKTIQETYGTLIDLFDANTHACMTFLSDLFACEGKPPVKEAIANTATFLAQSLIAYFPTTKWGALLSVYEQITGGHSELRAVTVGNILRLLRRISSGDYTPKEKHQFELSSETVQHREAYVERFPGKPCSEPCSIDQFLAMHPKGTFKNLEVLREKYLASLNSKMTWKP